MGLNDDWRFEAAFRQLSGAKVICFDHSVNGRFWILNALKQGALFRIGRVFTYFRYRNFFQGDVEHRQIKIGFDTLGETNLPLILADLPQEGIFLKVDIEGSEYRILDDVVANSHRFTGMVFEFHDIDLHFGRLVKFMDALTDFSVIAINGNNYGGVDSRGDPLVIEVSLVRNQFIVPGSPIASSGANLVRNDPRNDPIVLQFEEVA